MGGGSSKQSEICVASLNYAGITYSPFQFQSGDEQDRKELQKLSKIFEELASAEKILPSINESWGLKIFDTTMLQQRYCPLYRQDAGILRGRLMNRQDFQSKWRQEYDKNKHYVKFKQKVQPQKQKKCQQYDYIIFKTFVEFIYNHKLQQTKGKTTVSTQDRTTAIENKEQKMLQKKAVIQYQSFLEKHFSKAYLKPQAKLQAVKQILQKKDVVFLQDASDELINSLKNEGQITIVAPPENRDCAILLKKDKFDKIYDEQKIFKFFKDQKGGQLLTQQSFNYNKHKSIPAVAFVDNFLFISVHLHSSDISQGQDVAKMMKHLLSLKKEFPQVVIVLGGDLNRFIGKKQTIETVQRKPYHQYIDEFFKTFFIYPEQDNDNNITTKKTRTWLQTQRKKAGKRDKSCRDFIITSIKPRKSRREVLGAQNITSDTNLLTDKHPFDHFIVSAIIPKSPQNAKAE